MRAQDGKPRLRRRICRVMHSGRCRTSSRASAPGGSSPRASGSTVRRNSTAQMTATISAITGSVAADHADERQHQRDHADRARRRRRSRPAGRRAARAPAAGCSCRASEDLPCTAAYRGGAPTQVLSAMADRQPHPAVLRLRRGHARAPRRLTARPTWRRSPAARGRRTHRDGRRRSATRRTAARSCSGVDPEHVEDVRARRPVRASGARHRLARRALEAGLSRRSVDPAVRRYRGYPRNRDAVPADPPAPAARHRARCAAWSARPTSRPRTSCTRCSWPTGSTAASRSRRCPASTACRSPTPSPRRARPPELGIPAVLLFGLPAAKDEEGSGAWDDEGIVQLATRAIKEAHPDLLVITDLCLCEYTEPRPLRRGPRRRRGRQRRHARAARRAPPSPRPAPAPTSSPPAT